MTNQRHGPPHDSKGRAAANAATSPPPPLRIIVGVDFSPESQSALTQAIDIARRLAAPLVLVHAVAEWEFLAAGPAVQLDSDSAPHAILADAITLSTEWAQQGRLLGLEVETVVQRAAPEQLIHDAAARPGAALIIVGTHGRTGLRRALLGSVAEKVIRASKHPVLVVPPNSG